MSKMIWCINPENGHEVEMPEWVVKDSGHMIHLGLVIKPTVQKLTAKEVVIKLAEANTPEEIDIMMDGETRQQCIDAATKAKEKLNEKK